MLRLSRFFMFSVFALVSCAGNIPDHGGDIMNVTEGPPPQSFVPAQPVDASMLTPQVSQEPILSVNVPKGALHTRANHIYQADGSLWMGRGVNIFDTRNCGACLYEQPNADDVIRRIDFVVTQWHANFIRFDLESYATQWGRTQWGGVLTDSAYAADIKRIVDHATSLPGVYVLLTELVNPTFDPYWVPTQATQPIWQRWTQIFAHNPKVIFGVCNEPHNLDTTETPAVVWQRMTDVVNSIRHTENQLGVAHHLIAVQGVNGWSRDLSYYLTHPIASDNIVYESHAYFPSNQLQTNVFDPAKKLPVIIGEFGFWPGAYDLATCTTVMDMGDINHVPYIGWSFHWSCGLNMLKQTSADSCGIGAPYVPTAWGALMRDRMLAKNTATDASSTVGSKALHSVQDPNFCLTARGNGHTNSTPLELQPCSGAVDQEVLVNGDTVQINGLCFDDTAYQTNNGTPIILWTCKAPPNNTNQMWDTSAGKLQLNGTNKCIDISAFNVIAGAQLQLWDCTGAVNQSFRLY